MVKMCLSARSEVCVCAYEAATLAGLSQHQCDHHGDDDVFLLEATILQPLQENDYGNVYDSVRA